MSALRADADKARPEWHRRCRAIADPPRGLATAGTTNLRHGCEPVLRGEHVDCGRCAGDRGLDLAGPVGDGLGNPTQEPAMIRLIAAVLIAALPLAVLAQGDPVIGFEDSDTTMNTAMATAQATLPVFLARTTDAEGYGVKGASVKVAFPDDFGGAEVIWVGPFLWDRGRAFAGLLANEPRALGDLRAGDRVAFTTDMIRDWSWTGPQGRIWGNYTTRVMLEQMDDTTRAELGAVLSPAPVPPDWQ
ncbi:MAG: hypothetical protein HLUCCA08_07135 [Rhodobacteraceae bacterium HLUCCA08]|nr:MAG: hypothetical protein HLUCCA08_07135 [Rhodobacteraceae bacterium HLUCCA08]